MMDIRAATNGPAGFVVPFWTDGKPKRLRYLREALDSIAAQTDPNYLVFVVDDHSTAKADHLALAEWARVDARMRLVWAPDNRGPGRCRNLGVQEALRAGCPFVCFLDSDDRAHPRRVERVRGAFRDTTDVDVVYSTFSVIDEEGATVPRDRLINGLRIILRDLDTHPLEGRDIWITLACERDTLTIPTALNVRMSLAAAVPFPEQFRFHEDTHTWLRYSARGAMMKYDPEIPSQYRVPQMSQGSESRERAGGIEAFNRLRAQVILQGLREAVGMGEARGIIDKEGGMEVQVRYLLNVASMIRREGSMTVASDLVRQAKDLSPRHFEKCKGSYDLADL
jgi:hypothetical protein